MHSNTSLDIPGGERNRPDLARSAHEAYSNSPKMAEDVIEPLRSFICFYEYVVSPWLPRKPRSSQCLEGVCWYAKYANVTWETCRYGKKWAKVMYLVYSIPYVRIKHSLDVSMEMLNHGGCTCTRPERSSRP